MRKKYNIFIVSRLYLKNYYKFLITETNIIKSDDAFSLFMYSMKKMYGLEAIEYSSYIDKYGDSCIEYLKNLPDTPKNKMRISYEDRVRIVSLCEGYAQLTGVLSNKVIANGRMR